MARASLLAILERWSPSMSTHVSLRSHLILPWAVQEREDPVLEFDSARAAPRRPQVQHHNLVTR
jgi:hypothetical protein